MTQPRVLLVGMMGAGKTTVGRALAARTGWGYLDNDELVRRACGRSAAEQLAQRGEAALRAAESAALSEALSAPPPVVASVAGGVVDDPDDRWRLRTAAATVVWLRARLDTLAGRIGAHSDRPWVTENPRAALDRLSAGRAERYAEVADVVVDVDDRSADEVAAQVLDRLRAAAAPDAG